MTTAHLQSMGARELSRAQFVETLTRWVPDGPPAQKWAADAARHLVWP